jgi:hypothetical protein
MRLTLTEIERNRRELRLAERAESRAEELISELEKGERRLVQLTTMYPASINSAEFEISVTDWLDQLGADPEVQRRTESENEVYSETLLEVSVNLSSEETDKLFYEAPPWSCLVKWDARPSSQGSTVLILRAFAVPDPPLAEVRIPCTVPRARTWLWPLSQRLGNRQLELEELCTEIDSKHEPLDRVHRLTAQKQHIEYLQEIGSLLLAQ